MNEYDALPEWLKKLWELNPSLARLAEIDINTRPKISPELVKELDEDNMLYMGVDDLIHKCELKVSNNPLTIVRDYHKVFLKLLQALKESKEATK